jgi:hypothetical protein
MNSHLKIESYKRANMQGSNALDNYDAKKAEKSLKMLLIDESNEFRVLANGIGYPTTNKG